MNKKINFLLCFVAFITLSFANDQYLRFHDQQMLIQHHQHKPVDNATQEFLYIHLIPHTHDDVGWLKTVDSYYYGDNQTIQWAGVQYTIDTVIQSLIVNPKRRFVYVEVGFFYRWWNEQEDSLKDQVKILIKNKQLEFINGGWCMNDEANAYYEDIIDQMTIGHKWLLDTFNVIPNIGWHIDPFGHQASQAALFSQMGFNAWFFARIDYQDKYKRLDDRGMEMVWHPKQDSGIDNYIFTHVNYYHYEAPPGYCFDQVCTNDPIMDDPRLELMNVKNRSDEFVLYFRNMSLHYRSNNLMHTMGSDFQYANAHMYFKNMDKLMNYINNRSDEYKVKILYSTPSDYIQAINQQGHQYPTKYDDFFPYADYEFSYWTGYFTSRVAQKGLIKELGRYLQSTRTWLSLLKISGRSSFVQSNPSLIENVLTQMEQILGVNQHHDAVAGTEKQWVANDYIYQMNNASQTFNNKAIFPILNEQTKQQIQENPTYGTCNWNTTAEDCPLVYDFLIDGKPILMTVYNPGLQKQQVLRVKVPNVKLDVINQSNENLLSEIICANQTDSNDCDLFFITQLQEFSINYFKLVPNVKKGSSQILQGKVVRVFQQSQNIKISESRSVKLSGLHNFFTHKNCEESKECLTETFGVEYNFYPSYQGNGQKSGAYIFRPANKDYEAPRSYSIIKKKVVYQGSVVTAIHLIGEKTDSFLRFYNLAGYENMVELETFIEPISIEDDQGKELVLDIDTDIDNNNTFYTDSNGLEMQKRILNYRPTWNLSVNEPTSGNYYPVTGMFYIQDILSNRRISVINDRAQGGTSLEKGRIELMIHRRLLYDDARGVGEPLNETDYDQKGLRQRMRHLIVFGNSDDLKEQPRLIQKNFDLYALQYYSRTPTNQFSNVQASLPYLPNSLKINDPYLKIYLRNQNNGYYLLRLNNMNEYKNSTFIGQFTFIEEMTMTANQKKSVWLQNQLKWNQTNETSQFTQKSIDIEDGTIIVQPLEIRTFNVSIQESAFSSLGIRRQNVN